MSRYGACPTCQTEASGGLFGGCYIRLHKCRDKGHWFCENCRNGDRCPLCGTDRVWWNADEAYTRR